MTQKQTAIPKKRRAIPKKTRFEVLKRDSFTCQYCGRKSPDVILNIDHIKPVASGGGNAISNLITSCFDCNSGKGKRELSDDSVVSKQRNELELQQERLNQIKLMSEWQIGLLNVDSAMVDALSDVISSVSNSGISDSGKKIALRWFKKYDLKVLMEASVKSYGQYFEDTDESWEKAFKMVPRIASILSEPKWKQDALKYSNFARSNGYDWSDSQLIKDLISDHESVISKHDFKTIFKQGMNLREYCEAIMEASGLGYSS